MYVSFYDIERILKTDWMHDGREFLDRLQNSGLESSKIHLRDLVRFTMDVRYGIWCLRLLPEQANDLILQYAAECCKRVMKNLLIKDTAGWEAWRAFDYLYEDNFNAKTVMCITEHCLDSAGFAYGRTHKNQEYAGYEKEKQWQEKRFLQLFGKKQ